MDVLTPRLPRDHPLAGCEQKLCRAHKHFKLLAQKIDTLGSGELHPATFRTERKPNADDTFWTVVETVEQPPLYLATIIGDIVHNLRSSLDYLVFELAFLGVGGRRVPGRTGFPICDTRGYWLSRRVQDTLLDGVTAKHRALIYRAQPCYRRKDKPGPAALRRRPRSALVDLHNLWNEDKHRMVQLADLAPYSVKPRIRFDDCEPRGIPRIHTEVLGRPLKVGAEIFTVPIRPTGPKPQVYVDFEMTFQVCLREGYPVRFALAHIADWITALIQRFEPIFETPRARRLWGVPRDGWIEREPPRVPRARTHPWELPDGQLLTPTG